MKKLISILLAAVMLFSFLPLCFAASTGKYVVTKNVTSVYSSPGINGKKISELTKNTVVEVKEFRNDSFAKIYVAKDGVTGWVQSGALKKVSTPKADKTITGIKIKSLPKKTTYTDGTEELDLTGLKVVSVNKDKKEAAVTGYTVYAPEMKGPGKKTIKVSWSPDDVKTYTATFTVTVKRLPVTSISIKTKPALSYKENQTLDLSKLVIVCSFSGSAPDKKYTFDEIKDNPDFVITGCHDEAHGTPLKKGSHTIRIEYKYSDIFTEFTVKVTPRKLTGLTVKQYPDNMTVYDNKSIPALDGLILEAVYDNGEIEEVPYTSCKAKCDPSEFIIGPGNKVKVYFKNLYVTIEFRYSVAAPERIDLEYPAGFKLNFLKGEEIDLSGIKVKLVYSDGTSQYVNDYKMSTPDPTVIGTQHITVTYKEFSEVFIINISPYFSKGDVDGDGAVTAADARQTLRAAVGLTKLAGMTFFAGDTDRDEQITANDARLTLRASVGLENLYITL